MSLTAQFSHHSRVFRLLCLACLAAATLAAQSLQITSPAGGSVVASGQTLTVTVTASGTFQYVTLLLQNPLPSAQVLTSPPYQFSIQLPNTLASGKVGIPFGLNIPARITCGSFDAAPAGVSMGPASGALATDRGVDLWSLGIG